MSFFQPTEEEIKKASGGVPKFKHDEEVHFLVSEVETSEKDGKSMLILTTEVLNTEHKGAKFKHFIRDNEAGWGIWISILNCFLTQEQINAGIQPSAPIGQKIKSKAQVKAKEGKEYVNFYNFSPVDGAPDVGGDSNSDIPF